jgi:hypothetical protein
VILLFRDPALAMTLYKEKQNEGADLTAVGGGDDGEDGENAASSAHTGSPLALVMVRAVIQDAAQISGDSAPSSVHEALAYASKLGGRFDGSGGVGQVNYSYESRSGGSYFYVIPSTELEASAEIVVWLQYHILCADGPLGTKGSQKMLEASLQQLMEVPIAGDKGAGKGGAGGRAAQLLSQFEERSAEEVGALECSILLLLLSILTCSPLCGCRLHAMSSVYCRKWTQRQQRNCGR